MSHYEVRRIDDADKTASFRTFETDSEALGAVQEIIGILADLDEDEKIVIRKEIY